MRGRIRPVVLWLLPIIVLLGIVQSSGADMLTVRSASMMPTIGVGERVLVAKTAYGVMLPFASWASDTPVRITGPSRPAAGDIVAIRADDGSHRVLIKRVIGVPGDRVEIHHQSVRVNGRRLQRHSRDQGTWERVGSARYRVALDEVDKGGGATVDRVIPDGYVFVMGDNRAVSIDSRHWGPIRLERLFGKVHRL